MKRRYAWKDGADRRARSRAHAGPDSVSVPLNNRRFWSAKRDRQASPSTNTAQTGVSAGFKVVSQRPACEILADLNAAIGRKASALKLAHQIASEARIGALSQRDPAYWEGAIGDLARDLEELKASRRRIANAQDDHEHEEDHKPPAQGAGGAPELSGDESAPAIPCS